MPYSILPGALFRMVDVSLTESRHTGGVAQLVRACGSYPQSHWFKSSHRHHNFHIDIFSNILMFTLKDLPKRN